MAAVSISRFIMNFFRTTSYAEKACLQRCQKSGITDGHSLSQLLRTIGALVSQRGERLLGISWEELSVSIVVQIARGRRELDVFRPAGQLVRSLGKNVSKA
jgi:hypothetical protein